MVTFNGLTHSDHFAIVIGELSDCPIVRIHSECVTGDVFGSMRCDCGSQLLQTIQKMDRSGGVILYLRQEGRGIGLAAKIDAYLLQERGLDTFAANVELGFQADERDYRDAVSMLHALAINRIHLLSENVEKRRTLAAAGIEVSSVESCPGTITKYNSSYLKVKSEWNANLAEHMTWAHAPL